MFADNTLTPKEAVRLCALGTIELAGAPMRYSELASAIRHFISRITGPSLDIMGTSIELLRYEGLVEAVDGKGMEDDSELILTDDGRNEFRSLMTAKLRASGSDVNKLITTLKLRFIHLLPQQDQCQQAEILIDTCETELARLVDLQSHHGQDPGFLGEWLEHDIGQLERHLQWLIKISDRLCQG